MTYRLDQALAFEKLNERVLHRESCDPAWNIGGKFINGGYLQGATAAATSAVVGPDLDHLAVSTIFAAQVTPGAFDVEVDVTRVGRRISAATARIVQDGETRVSSLVTLGELPCGLEDTFVEQQYPDVAGFDECPEVWGTGKQPPAAEVVDMRFVPGFGPRRADDPANELYCWVRFRDGRPLDTLALVTLSDIAPPVSFAQGRYGWAPTLQMQVTSYCKPAGDTVLMRIYGSPYGAAPYACEDVDLWDTEGRLVARGRQIAMPPRPRSTDDGKSGH
ncbi:thioesterase family protein [Cumulibacter manganitolerans]|uniref:thioesterase family protein n=1 Tax=Cumulibacter manganitolerans TaxID=1884992 RepID=UPI001885D120|nr:thioesterase family protein [Cumulibacter manganitolerans]